MVDKENFSCQVKYVHMISILTVEEYANWLGHCHETTSQDGGEVQWRVLSMPTLGVQRV